MAPTCLATIFEDDNRGATSRGVSSTEIRVAVPVLFLDEGYTKPVNALFEYFNQRFELYGRRLVPVYVPGNFRTALDARSLGAQVASQSVFAALTSVAEYEVAQSSLPAELARQKIVTVTKGASTWWTDRALYDPSHPYVWSVYPSAEDLQTNLADLACTSLAGRLAKHAGDAPLTSRERRFAIVSLGQQLAPTTTQLSHAIASCTGSAPLRVEWTSPVGSVGLRTSLERLRSDGATTIVCVCEAGLGSNALTAAHAVGFHPEWILTPSYWASGNDENWLQPFRTRGEVAPPLRLGAGPKVLPIQARPWYQALQTVHATTTDIYGTLGMGESVYPALLLLAAGIQGAGPVLTPDAFAAGLMATQFPNPGAGAAPHWQPSAGFGPGDHSLYDDYNVAWWSDQATAVDAGLSPSALGSWCYLDQGARFRPGSYPANADERLFNPEAGCR